MELIVISIEMQLVALKVLNPTKASESMLKIEGLDLKLLRPLMIMETCFSFSKQTVWKIVLRLDREKI